MREGVIEGWRDRCRTALRTGRPMEKTNSATQKRSNQGRGRKDETKCLGGMHASYSVME